ncbi:alpha/beta fold hydrolase [Duganella sp. LX20W]|uniref:Alpha/beta fold hydrolase n=1 Tax=Rugamonas brunnea TaxID=2758569 RepID=A0A7W2IDJ4_9BURK|nr:alpha/beta fold hydrolase [Rugamonas brunnea]MBA5639345.1 alpha/beta fold hydrolase [Rugamonas brunnea]
MELTTAFASRRVCVNGITLNVIDEGQGEPVLLLHGFPDTHAIWRHQIPALVKAGYRVIAPDLRGCGQSDIPRSKWSYRLTNLVADVAALLDALELRQVRLVGHDWGAVISWAFVLRHPERVACYVALSVGHPTCYARAGLLQKLKGYYTLVFQLPWLPEWLLKLGNFKGLALLGGSPQEMPQWRKALSEPGRLTAGINYYRANPDLLLPVNRGDALVPVYGVWSTDDHFLVESQMTRSQRYCKRGWSYTRLDNVGHWMTVEAPEAVNALLLSYLERHVPSSTY